MIDLDAIIEKIGNWDEAPQLDPLPMLGKAAVLAALYQAQAAQQQLAVLRGIENQLEALSAVLLRPTQPTEEEATEAARRREPHLFHSPIPGWKYCDFCGCKREDPRHVGETP